MRLVWLLTNFGLKLIYPFTYLGSWNKKEVVYNVNNKAKFKLRVNTSDKLILLETWKTDSYINEAFNIKKDDVVVDIGANIGAFSILAAKNASNGKVFAYEPNKENYGLLLKNKALNNSNNLFISNSAIARKKGRINLFISKLNYGAHSIYETESKNSIKVDSITLKDIFAMNNLRKIDYLKIDAEGAEYDIILKTPPELIRRVGKIVLEYHDYLDAAHNHIELKERLENNGFKVETSKNILIRKIFQMGMIKARRDNF